MSTPLLHPNKPRQQLCIDEYVAEQYSHNFQLHMFYKVRIYSSSTKSALRSFGTAANLITCRLAQPLSPIKQWSKNSLTPHLCFEIDRPRLELSCTLFGNVCATLHLHSLQVLNNIYSARYALRQLAPQLMGQKRYSSPAFASKPGKSASHA